MPSATDTITSAVAFITRGVETLNTQTLRVVAQVFEGDPADVNGYYVDCSRWGSENVPAIYAGVASNVRTILAEREA